MKDFETRDWASQGGELEVQLIQLLIGNLLVLDVGGLSPHPSQPLKSKYPLALPMPGLRRLRLNEAGPPAPTMLTTRSGGRRPKSAKARNRGGWGTEGAALWGFSLGR